MAGIIKEPCNSEDNYMGKTGSVKWSRVKGRKGNVIMVPEAELAYKKPGPAQRYTSSGAKRRKIKRSPKALVKA